MVGEIEKLIFSFILSTASPKWVILANGTGISHASQHTADLDEAYFLSLFHVCWLLTTAFSTSRIYIVIKLWHIEWTHVRCRPDTCNTFAWDPFLYENPEKRNDETMWVYVALAFDINQVEFISLAHCVHALASWNATHNFFRIILIRTTDQCAFAIHCHQSRIRLYRGEQCKNCQSRHLCTSAVAAAAARAHTGGNWSSNSALSAIQWSH